MTELIYDGKYNLYYSLPNGISIGALKFYIDVPTVVGDITQAIATRLIPLAITAVGYGTQITRLKIWRTWGPVLTRFSVEASFYVPGVSERTALEPITLTAIAIAIWGFITTHGTAILAIIGITIAGMLAIEFKYGPVNPRTGEREEPKGPGIEIIIIAITILIGVGAVAYVYATTKGKLPFLKEKRVEA